MATLELSTNELLMLKDLLEGDIEQTSWSATYTSDVEYDDVDLMQFYLDRATILLQVREELLQHSNVT